METYELLLQDEPITIIGEDFTAHNLGCTEALERKLLILSDTASYACTMHEADFPHYAQFQPLYTKPTLPQEPRAQTRTPERLCEFLLALRTQRLLY